MAVVERESGYYWVKQMGDWEIMWWNNGVWHSPDEMDWYDRELDEIDERRITREH